MMPKVNGLEFCRRIRAAENAAYTYCIILTALDRKVGYLEGMAAGADDFMTKPCDIVELTVRLRAAERVLSLQHEVEQLEHLLPICPRCKRIKDEHDQWQPVESYISRRTDAQFSHGVCPNCYEKVLKPQLEEARKRNG
jgi:DNA-binding response OmpR family regulator